MNNTHKKSSRKNFLLWGTTALSAMAVIKWIPGFRKKQDIKAGEMVKMLSQDGRLVEIDARLLSNAGKKASTEELQQWVKR